MAPGAAGETKPSSMSVTMKGALLTGGAGVGAALAFSLVDAIRAEPKVFLSILANWGPLFGVAIVLMILGDRRMGELIASNRANADAQARMADAIQEIAGKSDSETMEQRRLMSYIGSQMEKILARLEVEGRGGTETWERSEVHRRPSQEGPSE